MKAKPPVSAVVTTLNEVADIERCLTSIRSQTLAGVEIVVVDNGSTDGTREIAAASADTVLVQGPERSAQRNAGARAARADYILFADADMELTPTVLEECLAAASEGVAGVIIPERSVGEGLWSAAKALERSCYVGDETIEAPRFFSREAFERYGGYDSQLYAAEDWDLPARMRSSERFGRTSAEIVHYEGRLTLAGLVRKKFYYGKSLPRYIARHPELARKQFVLIRPAFLRHRRRLARSPLLAAAMIVMKVAEFAGGAAGLATARLARRRNARRSG
jgi:glycosyltransferase involved in cell wall biosynthesis